MKKYITFTLPMVHGRGVFQYSFGLMPYRHPIHMVVGEPIDLPKIEEPSKEDFDKYHQIYLDALEKLYNEHRENYQKDQLVDLKFI